MFSIVFTIFLHHKKKTFIENDNEVDLIVNEKRTNTTYGFKSKHKERLQVILNGKSGSGKTSILNNIKKRNFETKIKINHIFYLKQKRTNFNLTVSNVRRHIKENNSLHDLEVFDNLLENIFKLDLTLSEDVSGGESTIILLCYILSYKFTKLILLDEADSLLSDEYKNIMFSLLENENYVLVSHYIKGIDINSSLISKTVKLYTLTRPYNECLCNSREKIKETCLNYIQKKKKNLDIPLPSSDVIIKLFERVDDFIENPKIKVTQSKINSNIFNKEETIANNVKYYNEFEQLVISKLEKRKSPNIDNYLDKLTECTNSLHNNFNNYQHYAKYQIINYINLFELELDDNQNDELETMTNHLFTSKEIPFQIVKDVDINLMNRCENCYVDLLTMFTPTVKKNLLLTDNIITFFTNNLIKKPRNNDLKINVDFIDLEYNCYGKSGVGKTTAYAKLTKEREYLHIGQEFSLIDMTIYNFCLKLEVLIYLIAKDRPIIDIYNKLPTIFKIPGLKLNQLSGGEQMAFVLMVTSIFDIKIIVDEGLRALGERLHNEISEYYNENRNFIVISHYPTKSFKELKAYTFYFKTISSKNEEITFYCNNSIYDSKFKDIRKEINGLNLSEIKVSKDLIINLKIGDDISKNQLSKQNDSVTILVKANYQFGRFISGYVFSLCGMEAFVLNRLEKHNTINKMRINLNDYHFTIKQENVFNEQIIKYFENMYNLRDETAINIMENNKYNLILVNDNNAYPIEQKIFIKNDYYVVDQFSNKCYVLNIATKEQYILLYVRKQNKKFNIRAENNYFFDMFGSFYNKIGISDNAAGFKNILSHWIKNDLNSEVLSEKEVNENSIINAVNHLSSNNGGINLIKNVENLINWDEEDLCIQDFFANKQHQDSSLANIAIKLMEKNKLNFILPDKIISNLKLSIEQKQKKNRYQ